MPPENESFIPHMEITPPRLTIAALAAAAALAILFHLMGSTLLRIPFVALAAALAATATILAHLRPQRPNRFAYLLLVPLVPALLAQVFFASEPARAAGIVATLLSLSLFIHQIALPEPNIKEMPAVWMPDFFLQSLFPFPALLGWIRHLPAKRGWGPTAIGALLAAPLAIVLLALFASADGAFRDAIADVFTWEGIRSLFWDGFLLIFLLAGGWALLHRKPAMPNDPAVVQADPSTASAAWGALGVVNAAFLSFIGFQFSRLFGGAAYRAANDLVFAEYARSGFFQLLLVAGIALVFALGLHRIARSDKGTRGGTLLLLAQTAIVLVSAAQRLSLYIETYGPSVARYWAGAGILTVAVAIGIMAFMSIRRLPAALAINALTLLALSALAIVPTTDIEGRVANGVVDRRLANGKSDLPMIAFELSSDAVPALLRLPLDTQIYANDDAMNIADGLRRQKSKLPSDWREASSADRRAARLLKDLPNE